MKTSSCSPYSSPSYYYTDDTITTSYAYTDSYCWKAVFDCWTIVLFYFVMEASPWTNFSFSLLAVLISPTNAQSFLFDALMEAKYSITSFLTSKTLLLVAFWLFSFSL